MKHNEKDKTLLRRYLDDLYTVEDVSKLADHLAVPEPEASLRNWLPMFGTNQRRNNR